MPGADLRAVYDERAQEYVYRGRHARPSRKQRGVIAHLPVFDGLRFLEVGCGDGPYLAWASRTHRRPHDTRPPGAMLRQSGSPFAVVGIDISPRILHEARQRVWHGGQPEIAYLAAADAVALPFPDAWFDVLLASQVIEHVPDDARALREMRRVLRPGGTLVISTDHRDNRVSRALAAPTLAVRRLLGRAVYRPPFLHRSYGRAEFVNKLRKAGFTVLEVCTYRFSWPSRLGRVRLLTRLLDILEERLIRYQPWSEWGDMLLVVAR